MLESLKRIFAGKADPAPVPHAGDSEESVLLSKRVAKAFQADPENPYLVSYSRTGSHWLRMIMELYFERPTLLRAFYFPERTDYLLYHTHDLDLAVECRNAIYLYRDPVDTTYSQMVYHKDAIEAPDRIRHWAGEYAGNLDKWLHQERFTRRKTVLTYEGMKRDLAGEFEKVTRFFGQPFDPERLARAAERVSKDEVKRKTQHDRQVVQVDEQYAVTRQAFRERFADLVWAVVLEGRPQLAADFAHLEHPPR